MLAILIATLALQPQMAVPDTVLRGADLPAIIEAVLEKVAPVSTYPTATRPLLLDLEETARAFREELLPGLTAIPAGIERPHLDRSHREAVVSCAAPRECTVAGDGIYVAVVRARRAPESGEYLLVARVLTSRSDDPKRLGAWYDMEIYVAPVSGTWKVTRLGITMAA
jgi:hypothetical protein